MIQFGIGTLFGGFLGAATILSLQNVVSSYTERWQTVLGITFILVMIFAPQGLIGLFRTLLSRRSRESSDGTGK